MSRAWVKGLATGGALALLPGLALAQGNVERGKSLFVQYCASCHGPAGKGDGPAASVLNPKPKNLTDKTYMATLKDEYVLDLVQKGGAGVGKSPLMPPLGSQLKEGDIRDVIAYLRNLSK
jgi:mono/diheme cytochrome c family protein